jgi:hypothetical protein
MRPSAGVQCGLGLGEVPLGLAQPIEVPSVNHTQVCATSHGCVPLTQLHPQHEPLPLGGPYWPRGKLFGGAFPARPPEPSGPPQEAFPKCPPAYPGRKRSTAFRGMGEISAPCEETRPRPARSRDGRSMASVAQACEMCAAQPHLALLLIPH